LKGLDSSYITRSHGQHRLGGRDDAQRVTQNQNLRFSGGSDVTRYLASLIT